MPQIWSWLFSNMLRDLVKTESPSTEILEVKIKIICWRAPQSGHFAGDILPSLMPPYGQLHTLLNIISEQQVMVSLSSSSSLPSLLQVHFIQLFFLKKGFTLNNILFIFFSVVFSHRNSSFSLSAPQCNSASPPSSHRPHSNGGYKLPVMFLPSAQAGNSVRLKRGTPHVVMANITTATPIRFTPKPAFTWRTEEKQQLIMGLRMLVF